MVTIRNECTIRARARSEVRAVIGAGVRTEPCGRTRSHHRWARVAAAGLTVAALAMTMEDPAVAGVGVRGTPVAGSAPRAGVGATAPVGTVPAPATAAVAATVVATARVGTILSFARAQLGRPYIWGGVGPRGFDCSGLVKKAFAVAGVRLPRGSRAQSGAGQRISRRDLKPGDLVFSNHHVHVQLYIGDGRVIEAARPGTNVRISRMLPARMIDAYVRVPLS
jgi:cell wall-associated NlpC family hydrolase